jgi:hypothetical protein
MAIIILSAAIAFLAAAMSAKGHFNPAGNSGRRVACGTIVSR